MTDAKAPEPTKEIQLQLLEQQKQMWINTYYSASVQWKISKTIGDVQLQGQAVKQMERALKAQDEIDKMIGELTDTDES